MEYTHPYLTVSLLDACNKACAHCYRTAVPIDHQFKLSREYAYRSIRDASALGTACIFVGGEPTTWEDGRSDYLDVLIAAGNEHGRVALLSNGHIYEQRHTAKTFLKRFVGESHAQLQMKFTVDALHDNYDQDKGTIPFMENLLESCEQYDERHQVSLFFLTHWTRNEDMNMPPAVCRAYEQRGVRTSIEDFMPWGRAQAIERDACYLEVGDMSKESLGPFRDQLLARLIANRTVEDETELISLPNRELLARVHVCGRSPNFTISWGTKYYYCIPQMGFDWFAVSEIGALSRRSMAEFFAKRPVIREIQKRSIFGLIDEYADMIDNEVLAATDHIRESIRFAGCSVCLLLREAGALDRINRTLKSE